VFNGKLLSWNVLKHTDMNFGKRFKFNSILLSLRKYIYWLNAIKEHRLGVFENRVLRRIFGPKRDEVTGEWIKLHNKELHDLYSSPSIIRIMKARRIRWTGHVARMGENRNAYRLLVRKPDGRRHLGRPRRRWLDNIRMDLVEVGLGDVDWIGLAQDRDR
jgi:PAS domain-containing protein